MHIPNAHSYWGNNCDTVASKCNGNGNKIVGDDFNNADDDERYRVMQHLSLAELIPGNYTGISPGGAAGLGYDDTFYSKSGKGKFVIESTRNNKIFKSGTNYQKGNLAILVGGPQVGQSTTISGISVSDAFNIDKKIDDGIANEGKFLAVDGAGLPANTCSAPGSQVGGLIIIPLI